MTNDTHNAKAELMAEIRKLRSKLAELESAQQGETNLSRRVSAEQHFYSFMDHNPAAAWIKDAEGRYVYTNKAHQQLIGYDSDSLIGKTDHAIFEKELVAELRANDLKVLESNEVLRTVESGIPKGTETVQSWMVYKFPLLDEQGHPLVGGLGLNITDHVLVEANLREALKIQQVLLSELDHRVRNNLASLATLIEISRAGASSVDAFAASIYARVEAMAEVHGLLSNAHWQAIELREMIQRMFPADVQGRVSIAGQRVDVVSSQATALGMVIQELVSNSLKYGALATPSGHVSVQWQANPAKKTLQLALHWHEEGGKPIEQPIKPGVGTSLIEGLIRSDLQGTVELSFPASGASHRFELKLKQNPD